MSVNSAIFAIAAMIGGIIALVTLRVSFYTVDETQYAIQLRFGEVRAVREQPGLYMKAPFVDSVQRIDKRTLRADIPPREVPDRDKERLIIDTVVRYRITDPLAFRKTLRTEASARSRLEDITYSAMRDTIAQHDRTEVIGARPQTNEAGEPVYDQQGLPVYESLLDTRMAINEAVKARIAEAVTQQNYGIAIIRADVKRADFPPQVRDSIIDRLRAERQRVAASWRADGEEEYRKRTASTQAEADILLAEARSDARRVRGEGEAEAIRIVEEVLHLDPAFYTFLRTMESYEVAIQEGAVLVITSLPGGYLNRLVMPPAAP